mgnify:CR=1 FL=1
MQLIDPLIGDNGFIYHLCGKSKEVLEWFLKYLSGILLTKKATDRPAVMIIFRDTLGVLKQESGGNGKDSFLRWFSNKIIGLDYYYECSQTDELFAHFNRYLSNKILINIPECSSIVKDNKNWSALKNYIDSPTITITSKGLNGNKDNSCIKEINKIEKINSKKMNIVNEVIPNGKIEGSFIKPFANLGRGCIIF